MTRALIDGDELILKACLIQVEDHFAEGAEPSKTEPELIDAQRTFKSLLDYWLDKVGADSYIICLSPDDRRLYRRVLYPAYKQGRGSKPEVFHPLLAWVREGYPCEDRPGLEADDVMGILSTEDTVIVSSDKDMRTVPSRIYNPFKDQHSLITPARADWQWMHQTLTGDSTDNYPGCTGCGPAGADDVLDSATNLTGWWHAVVRRFEAPKRGKFKDQPQTLQDALVQAQLARILRPGDYDAGQIEFRLGSKTITINPNEAA